MSITEFTISAGPTGLERLEQAISRLEKRHGFTRLAADTALPTQGTVLLLLTADPQHYPEVLDAAVILPEALKGLKATGPAPTCLVAEPAASTSLGSRYGAPRCPAVIFLRDGDYLGSLNGIRDWTEYRAEVERLFHGSVQPKPIAIPVISTGACS